MAVTWNGRREAGEGVPSNSSGVRSRFRRGWVALATTAALGGGAALPSRALAATRAPGCAPRVLVLSAMPLELNPLLRAAQLDPRRTVRIGHRTFYGGRLAGNDVVLAMSGIGLVNATQTATAAFEHFRCGFRAAVFSGVAGSRASIGDVAIPARWTMDGSRSWFGADPAMLAVARRRVAAPGAVRLARDVPVGDAACACPGVEAPAPVRVAHQPKVVAGGDGTSSDTYGGKALPCVPGGGDVFGCAPCLAGSDLPSDVAGFARNAPPLADARFIGDFFQPPAATTGSMDAQDQETAAVARVARDYRVPFLGVRAVSDGKGDPLGLPGFPFQFFAYRQLAGNNAAAVTVAFLRAWAAAGRPVARR